VDTRRIGSFDVSALGLGCMNLSHAYGTPPAEEAAAALLLRALDHGITHFDTAALYGFGKNETLLGKVLKPHRQKIFLASKCGMTGVDGKRVIDGRPETLKRTCEESLRRLQTDVIDLYYLHRWDRQVPIEDSVGALADLVRQGKVKSIGLSEVSAATLRRAHAVHPIAALQSEYSLWTRNPEIATLAACRELGTAFVAFSPLARAFLTCRLRDPDIELEAKDIRRQMPRFEPANYERNLALLPEYRRIADEAGCTPAQLALAWLLAKGDHILPIFGTRQPAHLDENAGGAPVRLDGSLVARLDALINQQSVAGPRYNAATQEEIDTETF
jgi:aryl-alcohol dehydrogenase-like predicted oxidoreductase